MEVVAQSVLLLDGWCWDALLAVYQPSHFQLMAMAVSLPARMTALQKLLYDMSREVSSTRYLL
jgi:hypothetical protein